MRERDLQRERKRERVGTKSIQKEVNKKGGGTQNKRNKDPKMLQN